MQEKIISRDRYGTATYFIDDNKGIVVCVLSCSKGEILSSIEKISGCKRIGFVPAVYAKDGHRNYERIEFEGRAFCMKEDNFDKKYGMRLAYYRARCELHAYESNILCSLADDLYLKHENVMKLRAKRENKLEALRTAVCMYYA